LKVGLQEFTIEKIDKATAVAQLKALAAKNAAGRVQHKLVVNNDVKEVVAIPGPLPKSVIVRVCVRDCSVFTSYTQYHNFL
jgi:hypothetical protein